MRHPARRSLGALQPTHGLLPRSRRSAQLRPMGKDANDMPGRAEALDRIVEECRRHSKSEAALSGNARSMSHRFRFRYAKVIRHFGLVCGISI
jgi:hypothetical protein